MADWQNELPPLPQAGPDYAALEKEYKLPPGILSQVRKTESGGDSSAVSEKGAEGDFQFMAKTAKQYGVDPKDPHSSARGAAQMLADLSKKYDGDKDKMLAGWNWGQGNVDAKGLKNAPAETREFTAKVKSGLPAEAAPDWQSKLPPLPAETPVAAPVEPEAASTPKSLWEKMKGTPAPGTLDESMSGPKKALTAFGGGLIRAGQGIGQMGVEAAEKLGAVKPGSTQKYNEAMAPDAEAMNKLKAGEPWYGPAHVGAFAGEAAPTLAVPGGVAGGVLKRAATGALAGGTIGAVQPVAEGESRTGNILAGAATGGATAGVLGVGYRLLAGKTPQELERAVEKGVEKGIRPGIAGNRSFSQSENYMDKAKGAINAVIENKGGLQLTNEFGDPVPGLPKTLKQFSQAIDQTKRSVFEQYNAMAGATAEKVDLTEAAKELEGIAGNKVLNDVAPDTAKHAADRAGVLKSRGSYTTAEAQEAIAMLNQSLDAFYKGPSYDSFSKAYIDSLVVNNMRKELDKVIEGSKGEGYQQLKNQYGALKSIEKDVSRRALVDARRNEKGFLDFSDVFSGAQVIHGLLSRDPAIVAAGASANAISKLYKWANDPNRIVGSIFGSAEKLLEKSGEAPGSAIPGQAAKLAAAAVTQPDGTPAQDLPPKERRVWGSGTETAAVPREDGGPVVPGQTYITGEKRPETLFNADGTVSLVGQAGPQLLSPKQPGVIAPTASPGFRDQDIDYDMPGYIKKYGEPDQSKGQHLTDEFKRPTHITFSKDSSYSNPKQEGGEWKKEKDGSWTFYASPFNLLTHTPEQLQHYFAQYERGNKLVLPETD